MDFMKEYEKWLHSPVLSEAERAELEAIKDDPKEIEIIKKYCKLADEEFKGNAAGGALVTDDSL